MLRHLAATALGLALLAPTQAPAASAGDPPDRTDRSGTTKSRVVTLGHDAVSTSAANRVRLVFRGKRGQLVNLARWGEEGVCGARTLKVRGGARVEPWAPGYWKLRKDTTYVATNRSCGTGDQGFLVQVRRTVLHDRAVTGRATTVGKRSHVTHLVPVFVGGGQRVGLAPSLPAVQLLAPGRRSFVRADASTVLSEAGRHWVELEAMSSLTTTLTLLRSARLDGPAIALPRMGTTETTQSVEFAASADQWVYTELLDATGAVATDTGREVRVYGPDGREVEKMISHSCPVMRIEGDPCTWNGPWLLPSTGEYRMTLVSDTPATEQATTLRLRAALVAPDLTIDGPTVTYAATSPGQWVVGRYAATPLLSGTRFTGTWLQASNATPSLGAWALSATPRFPYSLNCVPERHGMACDEFPGIELGPTSPSRMTLPDEGAPWALLVVPPDGVGSVDVRLIRSDTQP